MVITALDTTVHGMTPSIAGLLDGDDGSQMPISPYHFLCCVLDGDIES